MISHRLSKPSTSFLTWALAFVLTLVIVCSTFGPSRQANFVRGWNDFLSFYAGGKLAFTDIVYDPAAVSAQQAQSAQIAPTALRFIRLPHYAMVLAPLTALPYLSAFTVWEIVNVLALIAAVWLWPFSRRIFTCTLIACPPVYWGISLGQDTGLLLFGVSAAVRSIRTGNDTGTGIALAWCLIKFHLIWLAPVALLKRGKAVLWFAAIALILLLLPMLINPQWPLQYFETVVNSRPLISHTPKNLFPIISWYGLPLAVAATVFLSRRLPLELGFLSSIILAVVVSPHAYLYDYALLAPLVAIVIDKASGVADLAQPAVPAGSRTVEQPC